MPELRRINTAPTRPDGPRSSGRRSNSAIMDSLRAVEAAAPRPPARNARCCGRCKTPYNCGNRGCPCH